MQFDENTILGSAAAVVATAVTGLFGWLANRLFGKVDTLEKSLAEIPKVYVTKEDFNRTVDRFEATQRAGDKRSSKNFARLFDKLDGKEDKT